MLSERKRFNYMVNANHSTSHNKVYHSSAIKANTVQDSEPHLQRPHNQDKENLRNKEELEEINRKLVEETAKQFKKLEEDVQRVEKILEDKETYLEEVKRQNQDLRREVDKTAEEKKILIEAIFQKDIVIRQYEQKIREMLQENTVQQPQALQSVGIEKQECGVGTEWIADSRPEQVSSIKRRNIQLQEEVFRLKEQLFDATNKVKVLTQEFQAYKILRQIQSLQES